MKSKTTVGALRQFMDLDGLKDEDVVERKQYTSKIYIDPSEERTAIVAISTSGLDRDGDCIMPGGADLSRYQGKNAVVLCDHEWKVTNIVGKSLEINKERGKIISKMTFASTQLANDVWSLVKGGFCSAVSIGFRIKSMLNRGTDEFAKYLKDNNVTVPEDCQRIIDKFELLEYSFVAIPSNPEALVQAVSSKSLNLSDETMKRLDLGKVIVIKEESKPVVAPVVEAVVAPVIAPVATVEVKPEPVVEPVKVAVVEPVKEEVKPVEPPPLKIEYIEVLREGDVNSVEEAKKLQDVRKGKLV